MSGNTIRCGLDGCESGQRERISSHVWNAKTTVVGCLLTEIPRETRYVTVSVDIHDSDRRTAEIMFGLYYDADHSDGVEAWLTVDEAERLHWLLGSAIRRHTGYRQVAK
mgnify:CR=1 FL=1